MFTVLGVIGSAFLIILTTAFPLMALYEYKRSSDHPRLAALGSYVMILLAFLNVVGWIMVVTHSLILKNPSSLNLILFDLTLLIYYWTSASEGWVRRRSTRQGFLVMAILSVVLIIACVLIFI